MLVHCSLACYDIWTFLSTVFSSALLCWLCGSLTGPPPAVVASQAAAALAATANLANMVPKEKLNAAQQEVVKLSEEKKKLQDDLRAQVGRE